MWLCLIRVNFWVMVSCKGFRFDIDFCFFLINDINFVDVFVFKYFLFKVVLGDFFCLGVIKIKKGLF